MKSSPGSTLKQNSQTDSRVRLKSCVFDYSTFCGRVDLLEQWRVLLKEAGHPCAVSGSPEYLQELAMVDATSLRVVCILSDDGVLQGIAPIQRRTHEYKFDVFSRILFRRKSTVTDILGSRPLLSDHAEVGGQLLEAIAGAWSDSTGVYHDALDIESPWAQVIHGYISASKGLYRYSPFGHRAWFMVNLCDSFEHYLSGMSGKSRSTRRREVRKLEQLGDFDFNCCESAEDIQRFLDVAVPVSGKTWQNAAFGARIVNDEATASRYRHMADNGVLRSYSLSCSGVPVAFLIGYQGYGSFELWELGFDPSYSRYSPGTALVFKALEDLHQRNPPERANFGVGDSPYKRRFMNWSGTDETVIVLKNTLSNRLTSSVHFCFLYSIEFAKILISRKTKD